MRWKRARCGASTLAWTEWQRGPLVVVEQLGNRDGLRVSRDVARGRVYELSRGGTWLSDHASARDAMRAGDALS